MSSYVEVDCMTKESHVVLGSPLRKNTHSEIMKLKWLQKYSHRLLGQWHQWQTLLGIDSAYADKIREDLAEFYDDPLKKTFIESTYGLFLTDIYKA